MSKLKLLYLYDKHTQYRFYHVFYINNSFTRCNSSLNKCAGERIETSNVMRERDGQSISQIAHESA